jgi:hypothetical protein
METRTLAILMAAGRAAFGIALIAAPRKVAHGWIGDDVDRPPVELLVRALGARDLALGAGGVIAAASGQPVRPWLRAGIAADAADALLTAAYFSKLPRQGALGTVALAVAAAYAGMRIASRAD